MLQQEKVENVVIESDFNFEQNFQKICKDLKPTAAFDALGGNWIDKFIDVLPTNSKIYTYGTLSGQNLKFDSMKLIFKNIKI